MHVLHGGEQHVFVRGVGRSVDVLQQLPLALVAAGEAPQVEVTGRGFTGRRALALLVVLVLVLALGVFLPIWDLSSAASR